MCSLTARLSGFESLHVRWATSRHCVTHVCQESDNTGGILDQPLEMKPFPSSSEEATTTLWCGVDMCGPTSPAPSPAWPVQRQPPRPPPAVLRCSRCAGAPLLPVPPSAHPAAPSSDLSRPWLAFSSLQRGRVGVGQEIGDRGMCKDRNLGVRVWRGAEGCRRQHFTLWHVITTCDVTEALHTLCMHVCLTSPKVAANLLPKPFNPPSEWERCGNGNGVDFSIPGERQNSGSGWLIKERVGHRLQPSFANRHIPY